MVLGDQRIRKMPPAKNRRPGTSLGRRTRQSRSLSIADAGMATVITVTVLRRRESYHQSVSAIRMSKEVSGESNYRRIHFQ
jgi:hypothetical protein